MRRGPTGLRGTWSQQQLGNAGFFPREWDRAVHLFRGDSIPATATMVVVHEPLGGQGLVQNLTRSVRIMGLPGAEINTHLVVTNGAVVEIENVRLTGTITVTVGRLFIRNCEVKPTVGAGSAAITISTDGNLVQGVYSPASFTDPGVMIQINGNYNRIIGCDSRQYVGGIVDAGTGNQLVGNV